MIDIVLEYKAIKNMHQLYASAMVFNGFSTFAVIPPGFLLWVMELLLMIGSI